MSDAPQKGSFVLSIDTELAWGSVHNGSFRDRWEHYGKTRQVILRLLELQEKYQIHATWAVVGHLFLDSCRTEGGLKHPEITRPTYDWFEGDWFDADPCGHSQSDPNWYAPDIVKQIQECRVPQEIGCHGFSHIIVGDAGCSRECFVSEIQACVEQAKNWGLTLRSFVFPRNSVGHLDVLDEFGFGAYRGGTPAWFTRFPGRFQKVARLVDSLLPIAPPVVTPQLAAGGIWDVPASYFYPHREGWSRNIPVSLAVRKSKSGLARAARQKSIFHLWFHPFNLASDPEALLQGLEEIFQDVARWRDQGLLVNPTMGDIAKSLQGHHEEVPT